MLLPDRLWLVCLGVSRCNNPRDALRNTVIRSMRMPGYVPQSAAAANWPMNPTVRASPHSSAMLNRMPMPARAPAMCIDPPPMYGQQHSGVFQSTGGTQGGLYTVLLMLYDSDCEQWWIQKF